MADNTAIHKADGRVFSSMFSTEILETGPEESEIEGEQVEIKKESSAN